MRVCTRCLHRNEDEDAFCSSCGTFLAWSTSKDADDGSTAPPTPRPARRRSTPKRSAGPSGAPRPRGPAPADEPARPATGHRSEADELAVAAENLRRRVEANRRARAGLPPLPEPPRPRAKTRATPTAAPLTATEQLAPAEDADENGDAEEVVGDYRAADGPGPEQPRKGQPFNTERPTRQAPIEEDMAPHPGDVTCGRCQAGNAPSRYFCRRCGSPLQPEPVTPTGAAPVAGPPRQRWWHRLLWWRPRPDDVADTVAVPPSGKQRALAALPVVLVLGLVVGVLGPWRPTIAEWLENARKRISPRYEHVYPAAVQATTAVPDHPAEAVVDRAPNTYWSEGGPGTGEGEELTFRFDRPVDLGRVGFYNGAQAKPQDFLSQPRLREVHLFFDSGHAASLVLKDRDAFQNHSIDAQGVTTVSLHIVSVYPSPQGGTDASLGEVEFFTKS